MPAPAHFYVWFQVEGDPRALRHAIDAMMADISRRTGIAGRLLVGRDDPSVWMEIYENVATPVEFAAEIADAALRHGLSRFIAAGGRHVETFVAAD